MFYTGIHLNNIIHDPSDYYDQTHDILRVPSNFIDNIPIPNTEEIIFMRYGTPIRNNMSFSNKHLFAISRYANYISPSSMSLPIVEGGVGTLFQGINQALPIIKNIRIHLSLDDVSQITLPFITSLRMNVFSIDEGLMQMPVYLKYQLESLHISTYASWPHLTTLEGFNLKHLGFSYFKRLELYGDAGPNINKYLHKTLTSLSFSGEYAVYVHISSLKDCKLRELDITQVGDMDESHDLVHEIIQYQPTIEKLTMSMVLTNEIIDMLSNIRLRYLEVITVNMMMLGTALFQGKLRHLKHLVLGHTIPDENVSDEGGERARFITYIGGIRSDLTVRFI